MNFIMDGVWVVTLSMYYPDDEFILRVFDNQETAIEFHNSVKQYFDFTTISKEPISHDINLNKDEREFIDKYCSMEEDEM